MLGFAVAYILLAMTESDRVMMAVEFGISNIWVVGYVLFATLKNKEKSNGI